MKFDKAVTVVRLDFLDLFKSATGTETARVTWSVGGGPGTSLSFAATQFVPPKNNNGGYLSVTGLSFLADTLVFDLDPMSGKDDGSADYAVAAIGVVPIPAAAWLFGSALMGMAGIGYRRTQKA